MTLRTKMSQLEKTKKKLMGNLVIMNQVLMALTMLISIKKRKRKKVSLPKSLTKQNRKREKQ